jgi:hypothetical protein
MAKLKKDTEQVASTKSAFNKMKEALQKQQLMGSPFPIDSVLICPVWVDHLLGATLD